MRLLVRPWRDEGTWVWTVFAEMRFVWKRVRALQTSRLSGAAPLLFLSGPDPERHVGEACAPSMSDSDLYENL